MSWMTLQAPFNFCMEAAWKVRLLYGKLGLLAHLHVLLCSSTIFLLLAKLESQENSAIVQCF